MGCRRLQRSRSLGGFFVMLAVLAMFLGLFVVLGAGALTGCHRAAVPRADRLRLRQTGKTHTQNQQTNHAFKMKFHTREFISFQMHSVH